MYEQVALLEGILLNDAQCLKWFMFWIDINVQHISTKGI